MEIDQVIGKYIELRDKKEEVKKEMSEKIERIEAAMDKIEAALLSALQANGMDSAKTKCGTAFVTARTSATVADKEAFLGYIIQNEEWPLLDIRANKTAVTEFKTQKNGDLPPGINWREEVVVQVRRPQ
jgi:hypothetical protein